MHRAIAKSLPEIRVLLMPFLKAGKVALAPSEAFFDRHVPTLTEQINLVNND
jgi:hypothetical protein